MVYLIRGALKTGISVLALMVVAPPAFAQPSGTMEEYFQELRNARAAVDKICKELTELDIRAKQISDLRQKNIQLKAEHERVRKSLADREAINIDQMLKGGLTPEQAKVRQTDLESNWRRYTARWEKRQGEIDAEFAKVEWTLDDQLYASDRLKKRKENAKAELELLEGNEPQSRTLVKSKPANSDRKKLGEIQAFMDDYFSRGFTPILTISDTSTPALETLIHEGTVQNVCVEGYIGGFPHLSSDPREVNADEFEAPGGYSRQTLGVRRGCEKAFDDLGLDGTEIINDRVYEEIAATTSKRLTDSLTLRGNYTFSELFGPELVEPDQENIDGRDVRAPKTDQSSSPPPKQNGGTVRRDNDKPFNDGLGHVSRFRVSANIGIPSDPDIDLSFGQFVQRPGIDTNISFDVGIDYEVASPFPGVRIYLGAGYSRETGDYVDFINVGPGTIGNASGNYKRQSFGANASLEGDIANRFILGGGIGLFFSDYDLNGAFRANGTNIEAAIEALFHFKVTDNLSVGPSARIFIPLDRNLTGGAGTTNANPVRFSTTPREMRFGVKLRF